MKAAVSTYQEAEAASRKEKEEKFPDPTHAFIGVHNGEVSLQAVC